MFICVCMGRGGLHIIISFSGYLHVDNSIKQRGKRFTMDPSSPPPRQKRYNARIPSGRRRTKRTDICV